MKKKPSLVAGSGSWSVTCHPAVVSRVSLAIADSEWLYDWALIGTLVRVIP
jgi:hypothetical protein